MIIREPWLKSRGFLLGLIFYPLLIKINEKKGFYAYEMVV